MRRAAVTRATIPGQEPYFQTDLGAAFLGDSSELLQAIPDETIDLVLTSPPYALHFKKEYGNVDQSQYVDWLLSFAPAIRRILKPTGSFVLNIGGSWTPGQPTRALCHLEVAVRMVREQGFHLAQEFFWYNPAKLPAPAEWVNVRRIRVKDSVEYIWWFSKDPFPKANNQEVLQPYSPDMLRLLQRGYRAKVRPSGHNLQVRGQRRKHTGQHPDHGEQRCQQPVLRPLRGDWGEATPSALPAAAPRFLHLLPDRAFGRSAGSVCRFLHNRGGCREPRTVLDWHRS
jgi:hypothetical protein